MGIAKGAVSLLFELKQSTELKGAVCQLGQQDIFVTQKQLQNIAKRFGFGVGGPAVAGMVRNANLFESLGFDTVESIDYSDYEGATHMLDLNDPVPDSFRERYDVVFDGGTLEHVFNFPGCLKNIHKMLKTGGLIIHVSPSHNHVDHGFYMFSPTVFYDYYSANNYDIIKSYLFEYEADHAGKPWVVYNYTPKSIAHLSYGGWGEKLLGIWFVARKLEHSSCNIVPQQGSYLRTWAAKKGAATADRQGASGIIKNYVKNNKYLYPSAKTIWPFVSWVLSKLRPKRPPVIARY